MIDLNGLHAELVNAGLAVVSVNLTTATATGPYTQHSRPEGTVRLDWSVAPDATQTAQADVIVQAHVGETSGVVQLREKAKALLDRLDEWGDILRAEADVFKDEFNVIRRQVVGVRTATWDPASMNNGAGVTSPAVTVTGAALGDFALVSAPYDLVGVTATAYVAAPEQVRVRLHNGTGAAVNLASGVWKVVVWRPEEMPPRDLGQLRTAIRARLDSGQVDAPPP